MLSEHTNSIGELLISHLPTTGGKTVIVGSDTGSLGEWLGVRLGECQITTVADPTVVASFISADNLHPEQYDFICFVDAFRGVDKRSQSEALAQARDLLISRVLHPAVKAEPPADEINQWQLPDSLSLGYRRIAVGTIGKSAWELYEYNLFDYKKHPTGLTQITGQTRRTGAVFAGSCRGDTGVCSLNCTLDVEAG